MSARRRPRRAPAPPTLADLTLTATTGPTPERIPGPELAGLLAGLRPDTRADFLNPHRIALELEAVAALIEGMVFRPDEELAPSPGVSWLLAETLRGLAQRASAVGAAPTWRVTCRGGER